MTTVEDSGFYSICRDSADKESPGWVLGGVVAAIASMFLIGKKTSSRAEEGKRRVVSSADVVPKGYLQVKQIWESFSSDPFPYELTPRGTLAIKGLAVDLPSERLISELPPDVFESIKRRFSRLSKKEKDFAFADLLGGVMRHDRVWDETDTAIYRMAEASGHSDPFVITSMTRSDVGEPDENPKPTSAARRIAYASALMGALDDAREDRGGVEIPPSETRSILSMYTTGAYPPTTGNYDELNEPPEIKIASVADVIESEDDSKEDEFLRTAAALFDVEKRGDVDPPSVRRRIDRLNSYNPAVMRAANRLDIYRAVKSGMAPESIRALIVLLGMYTDRDLAMNAARKVDEKIRKVSDRSKRRRIAAAVLMREYFELPSGRDDSDHLRMQMTSEHLWDEALAPEYPRLNKRDAYRVALGEPIQKVFEPLDVSKISPDDVGKGSSILRMNAVQKACERAQGSTPESKKMHVAQRVSEMAAKRPKFAGWLIDVCGDPLRYNAFVNEREFATPYGVRYRSTYFDRMMNAGVLDEDISSPKDAAERVAEKAEARRLKSRQEQYIRSKPAIISEDPPWWPDEKMQLDLMKSLGIAFEHLQSPKEILEYGTRLEVCSKHPETYCPNVESGKVMLVRLRAPGGGALEDEESLMEIDKQTGKVVQHRTRFNDEVSERTGKLGEMLSTMFREFARQRGSFQAEPSRKPERRVVREVTRERPYYPPVRPGEVIPVLARRGAAYGGGREIEREYPADEYGDE